LDWEEWTPAEVVDALKGRYRLGDSGQPLPVEVEEPKAPESESAEAPAAPAKT